VDVTHSAWASRFLGEGKKEEGRKKRGGGEGERLVVVRKKN